MRRNIRLTCLAVVLAVTAAYLALEHRRATNFGSCRRAAGESGRDTAGDEQPADVADSVAPTVSPTVAADDRANHHPSTGDHTCQRASHRRLGAMRWFISATLASLYNNPGPVLGNYPCVLPEIADPNIDWLAVYGVGYTDTHCYEDGTDRVRVCEEDRIM